LFFHEKSLFIALLKLVPEKSEFMFNVIGISNVDGVTLYLAGLREHFEVL
jgi:hypothetical protein